MGEVYKARDTRLDRSVAIKVLPPETLADDTARARLLRDARLASQLNHPHVCTIHEVGEAHGQVYIAMELVEGQPLSERLADATTQSALSMTASGVLTGTPAYTDGRRPGASNEQVPVADRRQHHLRRWSRT